MKNNADLDDDDENRYDFDLLRKQLTAVASSSSDASKSFAQGEIWPLQLKAVFVDHYIFGDVIGVGSYAEVRECIDTRNLERCAIKIVDKNYLKRQSPKALQNQLQELRLLKRLQHDNIICLKECLYKGPKIYLVLEYCSFVLTDLMNTKLTQPSTRYLFRQLCSGVEYLHSIGIVHRDLKPQNALVNNCGKVKIIDFGVSQILSMWSRQSSCSNYEGSPLFQAPEIVSGRCNYSGFKADIWSLGVILYLMLFGFYPFHDEALLGLYDKILSAELKIPETPDTFQTNSPCPAVSADLLAMMLEKSAEKRASIEQVSQHCWLKFKETNHNQGYEDLNEMIQKQSELEESSFGRRKFVWQSEISKQTHTPKDLYRSMSVLPYLYKHHFPQLVVTKANRNRSVNSSVLSSGTNSSPIETLTPTETPSVSPASMESSSSQIGSPATTSTNSSLSTSSSMVTLNSDPNEIIEDSLIEWGTEEQYNLLKLPLIRANRIKKTTRKRRKEKAKEKRSSF